MASQHSQHQRKVSILNSENKNPSISGVLPVLHTPFLDDDSIDFATLREEIDWALGLGADGVVVAMVSEILRLTESERLELAEQVVAHVANRESVIISVGAESTKGAIAYAKHAENIGATAVMAIPPVATRLGSEATEKYFASIAESISIPLIVQDASGYVGAAIDLDVYRNLLDRFGASKIFFKPEASPLGPNLSRLRDATQGEARIFEGSGGVNLVDCYRRGIVGTMPGTDLLDAVIALWNALRNKNDSRIYSISLPLSAIVTLQLGAGLDGFLAIEKYLLKKRGVFKNTLQRSPVSWTLDQETEAEVDRLFELLQDTIE